MTLFVQLYFFFLSPFCGRSNAKQCYFIILISYFKFFIGEKCDVRLEVFLETDLDKLDDILVLHLIGGKDMFIIVSGECQKTCFTTSVSTLVRTPIPIMHLSNEQLMNAVSTNVTNSILILKMVVYWSGKATVAGALFSAQGSLVVGGSFVQIRVENKGLVRDKCFARGIYTHQELVGLWIVGLALYPFLYIQTGVQDQQLTSWWSEK